ncbi:unnamed protein product, partial [Scytosiphon promiscuus]
ENTARRRRDENRDLEHRARSDACHARMHARERKAAACNALYGSSMAPGLAPPCLLNPRFVPPCQAYTYVLSSLNLCDRHSQPSFCPPSANESQRQTDNLREREDERACSEDERACSN